MRKDALTYISTIMISALGIATVICAFISKNIGAIAVAAGILALSFVLSMIRDHLRKQQSLDDTD